MKKFKTDTPTIAAKKIGLKINVSQQSTIFSSQPNELPIPVPKPKIVNLTELEKIREHAAKLEKAKLPFLQLPSFSVTGETLSYLGFADEVSSLLK